MAGDARGVLRGHFSHRPRRSGLGFLPVPVNPRAEPERLAGSYPGPLSEGPGSRITIQLASGQGLIGAHFTSLIEERSKAGLRVQADGHH
jgi:hypothetical protein